MTAEDLTPASGIELTTADSTGERRSALARLAWLRQGRASRPFGLIVIAIGLIVIGIGWNGAAGSGGEVHHVPVVQAQLPWLLSGGFLGLGIVVFGAALLIADAHRQSEARLTARLDALIEAVERRGTPGWAASLPQPFPSAQQAGVAAATDEAEGAATAPAGGAVLAGTASYHRPGCRLARKRSEARLIPLAVAAAEGLSPCRVCRPDSRPVPAKGGAF